MARYEIETDGMPGGFVTEAMEQVGISSLDGTRWRVVGTLADDAALLGVLHRMHDTHLHLLGFRRLDPRS